MNKIQKIGATLSALVLGTTLAACGGDSSGSKGDGDDKGTITMGFVPSWTDGRSMAYLLENQLEDMGYEVKMKTVGEAALLYEGLKSGDIDLYPSAWPEVTHKSYMEKYGDHIDDIDTYYDGAKLTWAVPDYMDIDSIEDLKGIKDELGGKIIGIEPSAGLTEASQDNVIPDYDLGDDFELVTSSTTAMLAELDKAVKKENPIVVTLWRPFWANNKFPVKDLDDPKGSLGEAEGLHFLAKKGFADEFGDAADWMNQVKLSDDEYGSLEDQVVNKHEEGEEAEAVKVWLDDHADVLPATK